MNQRLRGSAMRGPRVRGCSDGASSFGVVIGLEDGDRGKVEVAAIATVDTRMAEDRACAALPLAVACAAWSFRSSLRFRLAIHLGEKTRDRVGPNHNANHGE